MIWNIAIGIATYKALEWLFADDEIKSISQDSIYIDHTILVNNEGNMSQSKRIITRHINQLISSVDSFKISKSGNVENRANAYKDYDAMYLLAESDSIEIIEALEAYYNEKYIDNPKNRNERIGSAGTMSSVDEKYALYIIVANH